MIYLIGGAPRVGKSILAGQAAAGLKTGWISTDLLLELLRLKDEPGVKKQWDASPEQIRAKAEWFFPYLERFLWGLSGQQEAFVVEGVDFLPEHVHRLSSKYPLRAVFLGCSEMSVEKLDQYPGRSPGYSFLPEETRRQIAADVPRWSELVREEAERYGYPYVDTAFDFESSLHKAERKLGRE